MSQVIDFPGGPPPEPEGVITNTPMRLRWGIWRTSKVLQMHVYTAALFEDSRQEMLAEGRDPSGQMPPHFALEGGARQVALAYLRFKDDARAQWEATYLSLLMETLLFTPCAILRTDLIRRVYHEVESVTKKLSVRWQGGGDRFMIPINEDAQHTGHFEQRVAPLDNLQDLFDTLKGIAEERHSILRNKYVFYYPRAAF